LFSYTAYPNINLSDVLIKTDEVTCSVVGFGAHWLGLCWRM